MAKKASSKKRVASAPARRATKRASARAAGSRSVTRRARPRRRAAAGRRSVDRNGLITHTELASENPLATREWCHSVLGWQFGPPMATPSGAYHTWRFPQGSGGGIRANQPPEMPGSIPYCEVSDIRSTFSLALEHGAREMLPPEELPGGMGWIAVVAAPGGVAIGLWAAK